MVWLFVVAAGLFGLYAWLVGDWFARIVAAMVFTPVTMLLIAGVYSGVEGPPASDSLWPFFIPGVAIAWVVSGIPIWVREGRAEQESLRRVRVTPPDANY